MRDKLKQVITDLIERCGVMWCHFNHTEVVNHNLFTGKYTCGQCHRTFFAYEDEYKPAEGR
jgi:hypothetical protein